MSFTEPQIDRINEHLEQFGPSSCPNCESGEWNTIPYPGAIVAQQAESVNIFKTLQVVQLICDTCGYVVHFDASTLGLDLDSDGTKPMKN